MYCTKSMVNAIGLIQSTGLQVLRIEGDGSLYGLYMHPNLCTIPYIPGISIYGWAPAVRWEPDSGQFTVYSSIKESIGEIVDGKQLIRYTTDRHKGWIAESYEDMADGIKALGENLRYKVEREYNSDIESTLSVLD